MAETFGMREDFLNDASLDTRGFKNTTRST